MFAGLQIPMDDTLAVRGVDGIEDLPREYQGFIEIDGARQGLTLDVLHHQIVRPDVVEGADVRMVEAGNRVRFALEALAEGRETLLDGDDAVEPGVECLENLAHAADANGRDDFVGTEPGTGREEHQGTWASYPFLVFRRAAARTPRASSTCGSTRRIHNPVDRLGRQALMARRLVERGVRYVQIFSGGGNFEPSWDAHSDLKTNHGLESHARRRHQSASR